MSLDDPYGSRPPVFVRFRLEIPTLVRLNQFYPIFEDLQGYIAVLNFSGSASHFDRLLGGTSSGSRSKALESLRYSYHRQVGEEVHVVSASYNSPIEVVLAAAGATSFTLLSAMHLARTFAETRTHLSRERLRRRAYDALAAKVPVALAGDEQLFFASQFLATIIEAEQVQPPEDQPPELPPSST